MSDDAVLLDIEDGVATITLNNPDMRNALTMDVGEGVLEALEEIEESGARCVVVEGAGDAFSAGGDVNSMMEGLSGEADLHEMVRMVDQKTSRTVARLADFYLPTIARIDGIAYGAGANLAIACDLQLASEEARISFGFRQVGLAVDSGTSYLLPRIVGTNVAKELVFTGELVEAERAERLGLFNHVWSEDEFGEEFREFVREIAEGPSVALRTSKRMINQAYSQSLYEAMWNEASAQAAVFRTEDHREGAEAFMERREPEFEGK